MRPSPRMSAFPYISWRFVRNIAYVWSAAHVVGQHVGELVICSGPSMHPTVHDGDLVIAERLSVKMRNLRRGDIIGTLAPYDSSQLLCKRMTAKEFDTLEKYQSLKWNARIPKGHVFLEGDNRRVSTDSRTFGPIPEGLVQIRLVLRVWPPSRAGWLSTHWFWEKAEETSSK